MELYLFFIAGVIPEVINREYGFRSRNTISPIEEFGDDG
jgi:hypothetical protein